MTALAIFDFDGTIYAGESFRLFLRVLGREKGIRRRIDWYYLSRAPSYALYRAGILRLRMMTYGTVGLGALLRGMSREKLDSYFRACLEEVRPGWHPAVLARLRAHRAAGDRVVIISGAFTQFLAFAGRELGCDDWIGTDLLMSDGRSTGRIGSHLVGQAKAEALRGYLRDMERDGHLFDLSEAHAYADGAHDAPLLSMVGHPVAVEPDRGLRKAAVARGWEVLQK